jgi:PIN domain nuclease of toxin-antitoxin system
VTTVLLDTHALQWWATEPERVSNRAAAALNRAGELAVSAVTWYEIAWLLARGRISATLPIRAWLDQLARDVRTLPITTAVATRAAELPESFPSDPIDRLIFATAVEHGLTLISADARLRRADETGRRVIW